MCIFAFGSATWWYSEITAGKFFIAYAAQAIVLMIFVALKAIRVWRTGSFWAAKLPGFVGFSEDIDDLIRLIKSECDTPASGVEMPSISGSRNASNVMSGGDGGQHAHR